MAQASGPTCAPPGAAPGLAYTLTALAVFAHNLDEMIRLPGWAQARGVSLGAGPFANAVLGLTLGAVVVFVLGRTLQLNRAVQIVVAAAAGALLANAVSHVAIGLATRSLMPGILTATLLVAPAAAWLLVRLPLSRAAKLSAGFAGAASMPFIAAAALWLAVGVS